LHRALQCQLTAAEILDQDSPTKFAILRQGLDCKKRVSLDVDEQFEIVELYSDGQLERSPMMYAMSLQMA
jgi:hypothetical protein